jgi:hypothetical protein
MFKPSESKPLFKAFNLAAKTYAREMIRLFPDVPETKTMLSVYKITKHINYRLPQILFHRFIAVPFEERMLKREEFFMEPGFTLQTPFMNSFIPFVQGAWRQMSEGDRKANWDHIEVILALSRRCRRAPSSASSATSPEPDLEEAEGDVARWAEMDVTTELARDTACRV